MVEHPQDGLIVPKWFVNLLTGVSTREFGPAEAAAALAEIGIEATNKAAK